MSEPGSDEGEGSDDQQMAGGPIRRPRTTRRLQMYPHQRPLPAGQQDPQRNRRPAPQRNRPVDPPPPAPEFCPMCWYGRTFEPSARLSECVINQVALPTVGWQDLAFQPAPPGDPAPDQQNDNIDNSQAAPGARGRRRRRPRGPMHPIRQALMSTLADNLYRTVHGQVDRWAELEGQMPMASSVFLILFLFC